ncbi:MAG: hypothetical protein JSV70_03710, partial [bacterium]
PDVYTLAMPHKDNMVCCSGRPWRLAVVALFALLLGAALPAGSHANSDVYSALPGDTRILQYGLADFEGDAVKELAVLYTTAGQARLTFFRGESGRWSRWWDDEGVIDGQDGETVRSLEAADTNGDGRDEVLLYYLTKGNAAMKARILMMGDGDGNNPVFDVILEDMTAPPGYPLLGTEGQAVSVTFMKMASGEDDGYRRVYCWDGEAFEVCKEVVWEKP